MDVHTVVSIGVSRWAIDLAPYLVMWLATGKIAVVAANLDVTPTQYLKWASFPAVCLVDAHDSKIRSRRPLAHLVVVAKLYCTEQLLLLG